MKILASIFIAFLALDLNFQASGKKRSLESMLKVTNLNFYHSVKGKTTKIPTFPSYNDWNEKNEEVFA